MHRSMTHGKMVMVDSMMTSGTIPSFATVQKRETNPGQRLQRMLPRINGLMMTLETLVAGCPPISVSSECILATLYGLGLRVSGATLQLDLVLGRLQFIFPHKALGAPLRALLHPGAHPPARVC